MKPELPRGLIEDVVGGSQLVVGDCGPLVITGRWWSLMFAGVADGRWLGYYHIMFSSLIFDSPVSLDATQG